MKKRRKCMLRVRIPVGTPIPTATQVVTLEGEEPSLAPSPSSRVQGGALFSYAPPSRAEGDNLRRKPPVGEATTAPQAGDDLGSGAKISQISSSPTGGLFQTLEVPLRSKPAAITFVPNRSGSTSFRVTVTIGGRQRRRHCLNREDAEAQQQQWKMERIHGAAASRPKITALTIAELREAEASMQILKGSGMTLLDCVRGAVRSGSNVPKSTAIKVTFKDALEKFEAAKKGHISVSRADTYRIRAQSFLDHVGATKLLSCPPRGSRSRRRICRSCEFSRRLCHPTSSPEKRVGSGTATESVTGASGCASRVFRVLCRD